MEMNSSALARACRPGQWIKNLLVFAAPLFAFTIDTDIWLAASMSLVAFCLISSSVYLLNDSIDIQADRQHPRKQYRPIAMGQVSVGLALSTSALLAVMSLTLAAALSRQLAGVILAYVLIQTGYCLRLKQEPLLDLFCIATGFLLRAIAGGIAAKIDLSPWFLLTVSLLALFLAVEKRKSELHNTFRRGLSTRPVLSRYSLPLLLRLESLLSTSTFTSYCLWASGPVLNGASTSWMLLTVPFVLAGIFRYKLISDPEEAHRRGSLIPEQTCEQPEKVLLGDKGMKLILLGWLLTTATILAVSQASE